MFAKSNRKSSPGVVPVPGQRHGSFPGTETMPGSMARGIGSARPKSVENLQVYRTMPNCFEGFFQDQRQMDRLFFVAIQWFPFSDMCKEYHDKYSTRA